MGFSKSTCLDRPLPHRLQIVLSFPTILKPNIFELSFPQHSSKWMTMYISRQTTSSSMFCQDFGHLCRGRRIQVLSSHGVENIMRTTQLSATQKENRWRRWDLRLENVVRHCLIAENGPDFFSESATERQSATTEGHRAPHGAKERTRQSTRRGCWQQGTTTRSEPTNCEQ